MSDERTAEIASALAAVRMRVAAASDAAGRSEEVDIVVVTKTFPASDVAILDSLGVRDIAENRDQEARSKRDEAARPGADADGMRWHMIGQLQRNKVASVVRWSDVIETVDRVELVGVIARAAAAADRRIDVLVQVALDTQPRAGRGGIDPASAAELADAVAAEAALRLRGVMGVAPYPGDPDRAFGLLADVSTRIRDQHPDADRISAGMSGDLEQAIAHGATQVRIGGAILGQRSAVQ